MKNFSEEERKFNNIGIWWEVVTFVSCFTDK